MGREKKKKRTIRREKTKRNRVRKGLRKVGTGAYWLQGTKKSKMGRGPTGKRAGVYQGKRAKKPEVPEKDKRGGGGEGGVTWGATQKGKLKEKGRQRQMKLLVRTILW